MSFAKVDHKVKLHFRDHSEFEHVEDPFRENLSAVAQTGSCLWLACDETTTLERLKDMGRESFGDHHHVQLQQFFDLPAGPEEEIDIDLEDQGVQDATVKIQAGFRGMQARKEVDSMKKEKQQQEGEGVDDDDIDIDLEDEGVQDATVKIQAGFRGMQARREVAEIRASRDQGSKSSGSKGEIANYDSANEYTEDSESGGGDLKLRFRYGICQTTFIFFQSRFGGKWWLFDGRGGRRRRGRG